MCDIVGGQFAGVKYDDVPYWGLSIDRNFWIIKRRRASICWSTELLVFRRIFRHYFAHTNWPPCSRWKHLLLHHPIQLLPQRPLLWLLEPWIHVWCITSHSILLRKVYAEAQEFFAYLSFYYKIRLRFRNWRYDHCADLLCWRWNFNSWISCWFPYSFGYIINW